MSLQNFLNCGGWQGVNQEMEAFFSEEDPHSHPAQVSSSLSWKALGPRVE